MAWVLSEKWCLELDVTSVLCLSFSCCKMGLTTASRLSKDSVRQGKSCLAQTTAQGQPAECHSASVTMSFPFLLQPKHVGMEFLRLLKNRDRDRVFSGSELGF